jgi:hypothetical protein
MKNKKGSWILNTILILLIVVVFLIAGYFLYLNIPGSPENLKAIIEPPKLEVENLSSEVKQFYPGMKFNHNSISYNIDSACTDEKTDRMIEAFNELENKIEVLAFYSVSENPDIEVSCSDIEKHSIDEDYFIAGEGGAKEIIQTERYNVITQGVILLHSNPKRSRECEWPNIELHELLHVFGFDHSADENSLMYPYLESCEQKLDEAIISDLNKLYSKENLADLYFEEVIATKKGRYLDFNISIKNSGVVSASKVVFSVFEDNKNVEDFDLKDITFGAGVNFQVKNLKLNSRNSDNIELRIDDDDLIKEIDEENNIAKLEFS